VLHKEDDLSSIVWSGSFRRKSMLDLSFTRLIAAPEIFAIGHIKRAIETPDEKKPDSQGMKVKKKVGEKTIVVVYSEEKFRDKHGQFLIITAYYLGN